MHVDDAIELADEIIELIEEDLDEDTKDRGMEFFEDVLEKVKSVRQTMEERGYCSEKQCNALRNWKRGVEAWIHE